MSAQILRYPQLKSAVDEYYSAEYKELGSRPSTIPVGTGKSLQRYLPGIALKIQEAKTDIEQKIWSQRFTEMSIRIFGRPDPDEAVAVASEDLQTFASIRQRHGIDPATVAPAFNAYERIVNGVTAAPRLHYIALLANIKAYLTGRFNSVYAVLAKYNDNDIMDTQTIRRCYGDMLAQLADHDPMWRQWSVVASKSTQMAVSPGRKEIHVGTYLPPLPVRRVKSLFTHEVLVHAQRSVRGSVYGRQLAYGLPGYVSAEEGLGVLMEAAIEGKMPYRAGDRYVDIALALGLHGQPPVNRLQLFPIVYARTLLRRLDDGSPTDTKLITRASWQHVNRIYRGTLGNEIVGVFTKDVIYYRGYREMADHLSRYKESDLRQAINFALSGKMNPNDPVHRLYVHDRKFNIIRETGGLGI